MADARHPITKERHCPEHGPYVSVDFSGCPTCLMVDRRNRECAVHGKYVATTDYGRCPACLATDAHLGAIGE